MSGWPILVGLALLVGAGLWVAIRPGRAVVELIAAALLVGVAGYAWQGSPALIGKPTPPHANERRPTNLFADERRQWLESVGVDGQALDAADGLIQGGDPAYAVGILRAALRQRPNDAVLWIGLGNALAQVADGAVTPPATFAFEHASELAPASPAPGYFLGLALAQSGDLDGAEARWRALVANAPAGAPWRAAVDDKLNAVQRAKSLR